MDVIQWLMDSDPAIRWQVMRDLTDAPDAAYTAERSRIAHEGWGARLLALQGGSGQWPTDPPDWEDPRAIAWWESLPASQRGTLMPHATSTTWALVLLRDYGLDPKSPEAIRAVGLVRDNSRWEHDAERYFDGEVEPCINGRTVGIGAYFGMDVRGIVDRLLTEQMADGGWNCEQENGSTRGSFHTTVEVLAGFLAYERAVGGSPEVRAARLRGEEYLLDRRLMRRMSTGEIIKPEFTQFSYPTSWRYDVLRGLDYLRAADAVPDRRLDEAIGLVESRRDADGRWPLENPHPDRLYFEMDEGEGKPSRWNTLRAMRVLRWHRKAAPQALANR